MPAHSLILKDRAFQRGAVALYLSRPCMVLDVKVAVALSFFNDSCERENSGELVAGELLEYPNGFMDGECVESGGWCGEVEIIKWKLLCRIDSRLLILTLESDEMEEEESFRIGQACFCNFSVIQLA